MKKPADINSESTLFELGKSSNIAPNHSYLQVLNGRSSGQRFVLPPKTKLMCGSGLENDITLLGYRNEDWQISLFNGGDSIRLTVNEGDVSADVKALEAEKEHIIDQHKTLTANGVSFSITPQSVRTTFNHLVTTDDSPQGKEYKRDDKDFSRRGVLYGLSIVCVLFGVLSAMYVVTGSLILVNADVTNTENSDFLEAMQSSELNHLYVQQGDGKNKFVVTGVVESREQKNLLQRLALETNADIVSNVQINDIVSESVEDIFRVNGIPSDTKVLPDGQVRVYTNTSDIRKLEDLKQKIRRDLPSTAKLDIINTEPVVEQIKSKGRYKPTPEKRITLISAGANGYIMTQDKSRYFVGALLPSGHLVEEIREGEVIVSKNGKRDTLKY